jgi:hypothetical protein
MGAAPDEERGVASTVNDTMREVGAALGIAVAGSMPRGARLVSIRRARAVGRHRA